jgi:hypothetical protein
VREKNICALHPKRCCNAAGNHIFRRIYAHCLPVPPASRHPRACVEATFLTAYMHLAYWSTASLYVRQSTMRKARPQKSAAVVARAPPQPAAQRALRVPASAYALCASIRKVELSRKRPETTSPRSAATCRPAPRDTQPRTLPRELRTHQQQHQYLGTCEPDEEQRTFVTQQVRSSSLCDLAAIEPAPGYPGARG